MLQPSALVNTPLPIPPHPPMKPPQIRNLPPMRHTLQHQLPQRSAQRVLLPQRRGRKHYQQRRRMVLLLNPPHLSTPTTIETTYPSPLSITFPSRARLAGLRVRPSLSFVVLRTPRTE